MQFETITKTSQWTRPLLALLKAEWPDAHRWLTDVIDDWSLTRFPQIIVALENQEIVGYYSLVDKELVKDTYGYTPWLGTLFVPLKYRGRHYSSQLIEHACQHVKQMGYQQLFLATNIADYYEKFGFQKVASGLYNWGEPTTFYKRTL